MEFKLIIKKLNNTLSEGEEIIFTKWYEESTAHKDYFNSVKKNYQNDIDHINIEKGWLKLQSKLKARNRKTRFYKYVAVASIILLIAISFVFNKKDPTKVTESEIVNGNMIETGTDKATLTLEDGSTVALEKGNNYEMQNASSNGEELVYEAENSQSKKIVYNYLTIPRGGQFFIKLSDGTQVWLNSESKLKYPVSFKAGETRLVELIYGEAYFDVSPSTEHKGSKFKVLNKYQEIEVMGTEFNIKAYKNDANIYTTLVEGKVSVSVANTNQILKPSQQANLNLNSSVLNVSTVNIYNEISWKDGVFSFRRKSLEDIMKVLSRWYDMDVDFVDPELKRAGFNGVLGKDQNIEDILKAIKNFKVVNDYEIIGKTVYLK
tara:strand:+ start:802 stop:1932 length:1131 start_codon:yes stop_codon:yes gene_type:complete